jgi:Aerotolerance regulator N-terminal
MSLSFLYPWFWLGALAVAAPLWLHLHRKQETNLVRFSTVRFLEDQPEPRRAPFRLRQWLLFALRLAALLLLLAGFAWPYWGGANLAPIKESRVYVLDNTLSHQANQGFPRDRDRILSEFKRAGTGLQLAVVELAATPRVLVSFSDSRDAARQRLQDLRPSFQRGSYLAAFRQANALLANSLGEQRRIILLGDNQENQWNENVSTPPFLRNVQVELPKPAAARLPNLSLSDPRAQRIFLGDKSLVNFTVKLSHQGEAKTATLRLRANGQLILNRTVELQDQPESILLQAQWEAEPGAWLRGNVSLEGKPDALEADNRVFFSLPPVVEGKVALLAQSPYLRLALSPEIMKGQWAARVLDPTRLAGELSANQDADVLCLESNYLQSGDARKLLWRYLTNGRGVLLLVNRLTPAIKGCLRELGFEADGEVQPGQETPEKFQFVLSNHPIFHPFLSPDYGNLMDIRVARFVRLRSADALPLVFSPKGDIFFFQGTKTAGKLFVAAFGLDREHTSWPVHQTFIPFLDLTLQAARAEDATPTTFEPGEIAMLQLPAGSAAREAVLHDEQRELLRAPIEQGHAQVRLPDHPGLYFLTYDDKSQPERMFSVNPPPKESQLAFVEAPDVVKNWQLNHAPDTTKNPGSRVRERVSLTVILQQRIWWWMVLGSLIALALETIMAEGRNERA